MTIPTPSSMREIAHDATTLHGPLGMTGYVVPSAGEEGGQPGWHHKQTAKQVVVDPHLGGNVVINPSTITQAAAAAVAKQFDVRATGTTIDDRRELAYQAVTKLASHAMPVGPSGVTLTQAQYTPGMPQPGSGMPPLGMSSAGESPVPQTMTAEPYPQQYLQQPRQVPPAQQPDSYGVPNMLPPVPVSLFKRQPTHQKQVVTPGQELPAGPPLREVLFEIEGIGAMPMTALFHDLIVDRNTLVLVFDHRAVGFPRNFPTYNSDARLAVQVVETHRVYFCKPPKHRFMFKTFELCVLEIETEAE